MWVTWRAFGPLHFEFMTEGHQRDRRHPFPRWAAIFSKPLGRLRHVLLAGTASGISGTTAAWIFLAPTIKRDPARRNYIVWREAPPVRIVGALVGRRDPQD